MALSIAKLELGDQPTAVCLRDSSEMRAAWRARGRILDRVLDAVLVEQKRVGAKEGALG